MIRLSQNTKTFGDAAAGYGVTMDKKYTVKEFIDEVVSNNKEWGYVGIEKDKSIFGEPCCEYRYGKLLSHIPEEYMNKEVLSATASGGWSRVDYLITIE